MEPDHYAALGIGPSATAEEVKQAFRRAALLLHPDKATAAASGSPASTTPASRMQPPGGNAAPKAAAEEAAAEYLRVQQAWAVLGDGAARSVYDRRLELLALRRAVHIDESVPLGEMEPHEDLGGSVRQGGYSRPCRCGGWYALLAEDTEVGWEVVVPCSTCSLHIRVVWALAREAEGRPAVSPRQKPT